MFFSSWQYGLNQGRVTIYHGDLMLEKQIVKEWIGENEEARIGEFIWIGEDTLVTAEPID